MERKKISKEKQIEALLEALADQATQFREIKTYIEAAAEITEILVRELKNTIEEDGNSN